MYIMEELKKATRNLRLPSAPAEIGLGYFLNRK
jgi:hypothetical protein